MSAGITITLIICTTFVILSIISAIRDFIQEKQTKKQDEINEFWEEMRREQNNE